MSLRRWTAWHEEWQEEVGCVAVDTADGLVVFDPLDPPADLGRPDHVLVTVFWHGRDTAELRADRVWSSGRAERPLRNRGIAVTDRVGEAPLPGGIVAYPNRALRRGRVLDTRGACGSSSATSCSAPARSRGRATFRSALPRGLARRPDHGDLKDSLRPLLELPVERVLVSHGEPVHGDGSEALRAVLA